MSLQVWLPLTKNLNDNGVAGVVWTDQGAVSDTAGKLGGCYYLNQKVLYNTNFSISATNFTIAYWAKFTAFPQAANSYCLTLNDSTSADAQFMSGIYTSGGSTAVFRFNWKGDCGALSKNIWYHLATTYDGTSARLYINGVLQNTITISVPADKHHLVLGGRSASAAGTTFAGSSASAYYNDVRIYDECLSSKEIKELANGLVVHYALSQPIGAINNCFVYPTFDSSAAAGGWSHWGTTDVSGHYGQTTDASYIYKTCGSSRAHWVSNDSAETVTDGYLLYQSPAFDGGFRSMQAIIKEENGAPITESICYPYANNITSDGAPNRYWTSIDALGNGFYLCKWEGFYQDGSNDLVAIFVHTGKKIYVTCCYLENNKQVCTDILSIGNTVYDASGNGYDATAVGVLDTFMPSARNNISTAFTGTQGIKCTSFNFTTAAWTASLWYYLTTAPATTSDWYSLFVLSKDNGSDSNKKFAVQVTHDRVWYRTNNGSQSIYSVKANQWVHVVLVSDGTTGTVYENGVQIATITQSGNLTDCTDLVIGAKATAAGATSLNTYLNGNLSDFRLYATALSEAEVVDLYNAPIKITDPGTLLIDGELVESTSSTAVNMTKTGIVTTNNLIGNAEQVTIKNTGELCAGNIVET